MSYGTVMTARLKGPGAAADLIAASKRWEERKVAGFEGTWFLVGDDGATFVMCASFESKASYEALADDPEQDQWYQSTIAPHIDGEPSWVDGEWA